MKGRRTIVTIVTIIAVIAAMLMIRTVSVPSVPVYQGKTEQEWLRDFWNDPGNPTAIQAFSAMGTNAFPLLLRTFEHRDSPWDKFYQKKYDKLRQLLREHLERPCQIRVVGASQ